MNYIFIDSKDDIEIIGLVEDNSLVEIYIDEKDCRKQAGNIYRGRVVNVLPGMEAAFIDIGEGRNAYLYVKNALPKDMINNNGKINIEDIVKNGEEIIVQVLKEASESKGAKVTTHITLPGRFVVLTPFSSKINTSRKINHDEEIERLKQIGKDMQKDNMGLIFRTKAFGVEKELLIDEYNMLINIFKKIKREKNFLPCPKLIYKEMDLSHQIIRDVFSYKIHRIVLNDREKYDSLLSFQEIMFPRLEEKIFFDKDFNVFSQENIMKEIQTALERKVALKSGGYIVIDETEALTAIDVNTGKFTGSKSLEDTVVKTNLEAVEEISKQIRLRDIGGIIIIDFIDMKENKDISLVLNKLQEALSSDRNKANIIDITKLGLVELTRKKVRNSLSSRFVKKCPDCNGRGKILDRSIDKSMFIW
ncbi:Ribonuclease, Rne/Rng family [[Clostridium] ultunense Esp]|uniref:Ribonuclease, Rne/Rng family n=1 Tax=[Clostridium] ultunense Esp TaxID=1288971 RepID=M1Z3K7_9FIRM|nr:Rne/Rng family ribonuclease [Schnuerera ultunensis]CCQ92616.1 Ribonuclease, Rne/Rng family [[Clostridium] ultunense Esp]SHD77936.1 Ribonuclease, Rne/Rng family [[Clostridium] ultunense Esp]